MTTPIAMLQQAASRGDSGGWSGRWTASGEGSAGWGYAGLGSAISALVDRDADPHCDRGPVRYHITVPGSYLQKLTVSAPSGHLSAGQSKRVTVTAASGGLFSTAS
jgi:hypothetical protein